MVTSTSPPDVVGTSSRIATRRPFGSVILPIVVNAVDFGMEDTWNCILAISRYPYCLYSHLANSVELTYELVVYDADRFVT